MRTVGKYALVCVGVGLFFFTAGAGDANAALRLKPSALVMSPEYATKAMPLDGFVVCSNAEDNDMALADIGDIAAKNTRITKHARTLASGTTCIYIANKNFYVVLTGRGVEVQGLAGAYLILEAERPGQKIRGYVLLPLDETATIAEK